MDIIFLIYCREMMSLISAVLYKKVSERIVTQNSVGGGRC
jgi:hypothetical protein